MQPKQSKRRRKSKTQGTSSQPKTKVGELFYKRTVSLQPDTVSQLRAAWDGYKGRSGVTEELRSMLRIYNETHLLKYGTGCPSCLEKVLQDVPLMLQIHSNPNNYVY